MSESLVRELAEHPIDVSAPLAMEQRELALGRSFVGFGEFDQRLEETALIGVVAIAARTALQAGCGDLQRFQGEIANGAVADVTDTSRQLQCVPGHAIAQRIAFDQAEVL